MDDHLGRSLDNVTVSMRGGMGLCGAERRGEKGRVEGGTLGTK